MELFYRRYLCLISFVFLFSAFLMTLFSGTVKLAVGIVSALGVILCIVLAILKKKHRFISLLSSMICIAVSVSALSSYFVISRAEDEANSLLGENTVWVRVINENYDGEYDVRLLRVGDKYVNIKAELSFDGVDELDFGDELIFNAAIERASDNSERSKLISLAVTEEDRVFIKKSENISYFSVDGISALCHGMQEAFSNHVDSVFGDHSAIAKGLLVNNTEDIDARTKTAFKRSGTSHILAVSGMHISLLMGAIDIFLRALRVRKGARIAVVSVCALLFLVIAAFAASAVRSVIMLYAVYLCYILYEENDAQSSLFVSISLIVLFSPYSVYDLGMWMSFFATLGLLVVYPQFSDRLPYPKQKNRLVRYSLRALSWCARALVLTSVANFFLLPIMWYFFGSISISALPCNLILSPIVTVLMPLCAITTVVGAIPYVGIPFVFLSNKLIDLMMLVVNYFAEMRFGVVSLNFEFAAILVVLFAASLAVMLVIRLKHKSLIFVPMLAFVLSFGICLAVFNATSSPELTYLKSRDAELVFVSNGTECSVIDIGEYDGLKGQLIVRNMSKYATEIDEYIIANPDNNDAKALERVCKNTVVRKVVIPKTLENKDLTIYNEIFKCAEKYNIQIILFDFDESVEICNNVRFCYNANDEIYIGSDTAYISGATDNISYTYGARSVTIAKGNRIHQNLPLD